MKTVVNDHETLRLDLAIQTALGRTEELASSSTLCRWENRVDRETAGRMHEVIVEQFIASFKKAPKKLILDFDATDDVVHGKQEGRFFHGYYDHYCFLPLYVFCRNQLLVSYLRPSLKETRSTAPSMPGPSQDSFTLDEGQVVFQYPTNLSKASVEFLEMFMNLQIKKAKAKAERASEQHD